MGAVREKSPVRTSSKFALAVLLFGASPASAESIAREWNEILLGAIRLDYPAPTVHSRNLFHLSAAMWDAWAAYDANAQGYFVDEAATAADVEAARAKAMSFAAYRILKFRFVEPKCSPGTAAFAATQFDGLMDELGYDESFSATSGDVDPAAELGNRVGAAVIAAGLADGSNEGGTPPYGDPTYTALNPPMVVDLPGVLQPTEPGEAPPELPEPNHWQPLSLDFLVLQNGIVVGAATQKFLGSAWGNVAPFATLRATPEDVYEDQGDPPALGCDSAPPCALDTKIKDEVVDLVRKSSQIDPDDGALLDISPASYGNNPLASNEGTGYPANPFTGLPYTANVVPRADFARALAEYWADGPQSETPPGHWNTIANSVSDSPLLVKQIAGEGSVVGDLEWDVKLYFALNGAVYDAAISAWDHKRKYDTSRPITLIRYMGDKGQSTDTGAASYHPDGLPLVPGLIEEVTAESSAAGERHEFVLRQIGTEPPLFEPAIGEIAIYAWGGQPAQPESEYAGARWMRAIEWLPYMKNTFVTPPFAGYISGHSTFSRSAAEVLTLFTGDAFFPGGLGTFTTPQNTLDIELGPTQDIELQWARYYDAADQAGIARLLSGIHIRADDFGGRTAGSAIGIAAYQRAQEYFVPEPAQALAQAAALVAVALLARFRSRTISDT
jgi:hypothetical protein